MLLPHAPFFVGISFLAIVIVHSVDGIAVFAVFVFMKQGQDEALFGLHPSGARGHAHPVGLRHAPSYQQFGFQVLRVFSGNGFSGSMIEKAGFAGTSVNAGLRDSGIEIDGLLSKFDAGCSGMVLDGIFADTVDLEDSLVASGSSCKEACSI